MKNTKLKCPECGKEMKVVSFSSKTTRCSACRGLEEDTSEKGLSSEKVTESTKPVGTKLPRQTKRKKLNTVTRITQTDINIPNTLKKRKRRQSQQIVPICVGAAVFLLLLIITAAGSANSSNSQNVSRTQKSSTIKTDSSKISYSLNNRSVKETAETITPLKKTVAIRPNNKVTETISPEKKAVTEPPDKKAPVKSPVTKTASVKTPVKKAASTKTPAKKAASTKTPAKKIIAKIPDKKNDKVFILSPDEEAYRDELLAVERTELSENERNALNMLNNKYAWYKSKRYHMDRATMDKEWRRRWDEIKESNEIVISRSDSLKRRSLQILLEKCKTQKERAHMINIHLRPNTPEERKMVKDAKAQATRERENRKKAYRIYFEKKEEKKIYQDEYGYSYYIVDGNRKYIEKVPEKSKSVVAAKTDKSSGPIILDPKEEAYRKKLTGLDRRDMTEQQKNTLNMLNNKYLWYKSKRYHMTRAQMDTEWKKRNGEIQNSNEKIKSSSDSQMHRALQILLEQCKTTKERAYMMRIYQKPVSKKEKDLVAKAHAQAKYERTMNHKRYKEDRNKEKDPNVYYRDKYGYKYYVNKKGFRVYVDE